MGRSYLGSWQVETKITAKLCQSHHKPLFLMCATVSKGTSANLSVRSDSLPIVIRVFYSAKQASSDVKTFPQYEVANVGIEAHNLPI